MIAKLMFIFICQYWVYTKFSISQVIHLLSILICFILYSKTLSKPNLLNTSYIVWKRRVVGLFTQMKLTKVPALGLYI